MPLRLQFFGVLTCRQYFNVVAPNSAESEYFMVWYAGGQFIAEYYTKIIVLKG